LKPDRRLSLSDFDFELPPELIAQRPAAVRGESRLLVVRRADGRTGRRAAPTEPTGSTDQPDLPDLSDRTFADLSGIIPSGDLLVLNTSRVRHARFLGTRPSGAAAEVLLIHPGTEGTWIALGKPGSAMQPGKRIRIGPDVFVETVAVLEDGNREVRFIGMTAEEAITSFGRLPLPPYVARDPDESDEDRYQTVYADREGSVAAPTAGLHFTPQLLSALRANGVRLGTLDLEVGPGTFKPVESERLSEHVMHPERFQITSHLAEAVRDTRAAGGHVWAVGTTVARALESAAERGGLVRATSEETRLFITPGYRFRVVDRLITNFHLPRSTLLMLVSAFAGLGTVRASYRHAIDARYRFYSYGDAMALI
jgi:S-adenosylmethionine:tRNA ribosyltransferase-isomerase